MDPVGAGKETYGDVAASVVSHEVERCAAVHVGDGHSRVRDVTPRLVGDDAENSSGVALRQGGRAERNYYRKNCKNPGEFQEPGRIEHEFPHRTERHSRPPPRNRYSCYTIIR